MHVALLTVQLAFPGCRSLKEKRRRTGGLRERLGRQPSVALLESAWQDVADRGEWSFVLAAQTRAQLDRMQAMLESDLAALVDGVVGEVHRQIL